MKNLLCLLNVSHRLTQISVEEGTNDKFRYVETCGCGNKVEKGEWTTTIRQGDERPVQNERIYTEQN
jgi:hypothetical protein